MKSNLIDLIRFLLQNARAVKHARLMMGLILLVGVISGFSNAALLAMINQWLSNAGRPSSTLFIIIFFALCLMLPLTRFASEAMLIKLSTKAILELRLQLSRQILGSYSRLSFLTFTCLKVYSASTRYISMRTHETIWSNCNSIIR